MINYTDFNISNFATNNNPCIINNKIDAVCIYQKVCSDRVDYVKHTALVLIIAFVIIDALLPLIMRLIAKWKGWENFYFMYPEALWLGDIRLIETREKWHNFIKSKLLYCFFVFSLFLLFY